jgi:hypothetical protein
MLVNFRARLDSGETSSRPGLLVVDSTSLASAIRSAGPSREALDDGLIRVSGVILGVADTMTRCEQASWEHGCYTLNNAVLLKTDRVEIDSAGYTIFVTVSKTLKGPPRSVCPVQASVRLDWTSAGWTVARRNLTAC